MTERWRCFVALPIGDDLRSALGAAVEAWHDRPDLADLRWTDPDSWHITLAFLGSVDAERVRRIGDAVRDVASRHETSELTGSRIGAFPSAGRARVAWYGIVDSDGKLKRLAREIRAALDVDVGQPFRPHVTIARARGEPADLRAFLSAERGPSMTWRADRVDLMRSHLGRGPAHYELIGSAALGAALHV